MSQNQYSTNPSSISCSQAGGYSSPNKELIRCLKKICHELKRANHLSEINLYIRLAEIARERGDAFGYDWAAMMCGLEPQKRKRKKYVSPDPKRWWLG